MTTEILHRVDRETPVIRARIETRLSAQERYVLVAAARANRANPVLLQDVLDHARGIAQRNHLSSVMNRLVRKGFLVRIGRGRYDFADESLRLHLRFRHCGRPLPSDG